MATTPLYVLGVGMATPLGLTADSSTLAMLAQRDQKAQSPYVDELGEPIVTSRLEALDEACRTDQRWFAWLTYALDDLVQRAGPRVLEETPVLCVRAPGAALTLVEMSDRLQQALGVRLDLHLLEGDAVTAFSALRRARELLARGARSVVVCAADSSVTPRRLRGLSEARRLLTESNPDGVIPGEGGACLLLSTHQTGAFGVIRGLGFGEEPARPDNDLPLRADGLVAATRMALREASLALHELDERVSDAAGDSYAFKEQTLALARVLRSNMESFPLRLPALSLGDTGAAASLCGLVTALPRIVPRGHVLPRRSLVHASGASGARASAVIERLEMG